MTIEQRLNEIAWNEVIDALWRRGCSRLGTLLDRGEAEQLRALYTEGGSFRSRIDMARYRFGRGEYQYFAYPLPAMVEELRHGLYRRLAGVARAWMAALSLEGEYPDRLEEFLEACHEKGQARPTPLLLRYAVGDFNCPHQDLYGDIVFPFQVVFCLSKPQE